MLIEDSIPLEFKWYYDNKYITSRDGNACIQIADDKFLVTGSGTYKPLLQHYDFKLINWNMDVFHRTDDPREKKITPSIETKGHLLSLKHSLKSASVHVHSPKTVALFETFCHDNIEDNLVHAINSKWPEIFRYTKVGPTIPYLEPGSKELHDNIEQSFETGCDIAVMNRHGVIANGRDMRECREHIERLEHISSILLDIYGGDIKNVSLIL